MPNKRQKLIWIKWANTLYDNDTCVSRVDLESGGLLVYEDKDSIHIALEYCTKSKTSRRILCIPRVDIISIVYF